MAARPEPLRQVRERELVKATRALFDERGVQEAPIEEIARMVGIARGLVYRQFSSKDELYVLTVTDYLAELEEVLRAARATGEPDAQLVAVTRAFAGFCSRYPAFLDCALSLMRGPARELRERVSDSVWLRLGEGMAACIGQLAEILDAIGVDEPDYMANVLWTQVLGVMHLARIRVGVRRGADGPELFEVDHEGLAETCVRAALAQT